MKTIFKSFIENIKIQLNKLSFRTGLIILCLCIPFYVLSFAQMALNISYSMKAALWILLFGVAKTFQYIGLAIMGVEGIKKIKTYWFKFRNNKEVID